MPLNVSFETLARKSLDWERGASDSCSLCNVCSRSVFFFGRVSVCIFGPRKYSFLCLRLLGFVFVVVSTLIVPMREVHGASCAFQCVGPPPPGRAEYLLPHALQEVVFFFFF